MAWLFEVFEPGARDDVVLIYETCARMCADIYTKAFTDSTKWKAAQWLINVIDPAEWSAVLKHWYTNLADAAEQPAWMQYRCTPVPGVDAEALCAVRPGRGGCSSPAGPAPSFSASGPGLHPVNNLLSRISSPTKGAGTEKRGITPGRPGKGVVQDDQRQTVLIELCCAQDSALSFAASAEGMTSIRVTHEDDITSDETIKWVASMVSPENRTVIWFTPPVAGGTHATRSQSMRSRRAKK